MGLNIDPVFACFALVIALAIAFAGWFFFKHLAFFVKAAAVIFVPWGYLLWNWKQYHWILILLVLVLWIVMIPIDIVFGPASWLALAIVAIDHIARKVLVRRGNNTLLQSA
jgi:hypothetical protein